MIRTSVESGAGPAGQRSVANSAAALWAIGAALVGLCLALQACNKQKLIPNTKLLDSEQNRELLRVVERYRRAVERRDVSGVLALVHPRYQDNAGTPDASDDLDRSGVQRLLSGRFSKTKHVRLRIEYQRIKASEQLAEIDTWIDATFVYKHDAATPRWRRLTDYNRFRLAKQGNTWLFIGGL